MLRMEQKIRQAQRRGDIVALVEYEITAGIYFAYDKPLGPLSILEAECAIDGCSKHLEYSNCSFCFNHHVAENGCNVNATYYPEEIRTNKVYTFVDYLHSLTKGFANKKVISSAEGSGFSCNFKREERLEEQEEQYV
jgi:hypothetical protein